MNRIKLIDLFTFYKKEPHQMAAIQELEAFILAADPTALDRDNAWYGTWTSAPKEKEPLVDPKQNTWWGVYKVAQRAGAKFPELASAQWALESGWGKHTSGRNNYFGLKGKGTKTQTQEVVNGHTITITASFLDFESLQDCVDYLVTRWYKDYKGYKGCNNASDRYLAAEWLVKEKYATDPEYAAKLCSLMRAHAPEDEHEKKPAMISPRSPFTAHLTPNIRLGEFSLDQQERRFLHQYQVDVAAELAAFLERVRRNFGNKPVVITSGYRPKAVNDAIGGARDSEHLFSGPGVGACDFYVEGADINEVQRFCDRYWDRSLGLGAAKGFVHLGMRKGNPRVRWNY